MGFIRSSLYAAAATALFSLQACSNHKDAHEQATSTDTAQHPAQPSVMGLTDHSTHFLTRGLSYDSTVRDSVSTIVIDDAYANNMPDAERAAVGYVATFIGSDCDWDGEANKDLSNLKCKVMSALHLGYQCSEEHLGFLRKWFRQDTAALASLSDCSAVPFTATVQETFDRIDVTVRKDTIAVYFEASGINMREQRSWSWRETDYFLLRNDQLSIVRKDRSKVVTETMGP